MNTSERKKSGIALFGTNLISSFQSSDYRLYFLGTIAQFASMSMQIVAGPMLMYRLTGSAALLGTMSLVGALPMIILSMPAGALADRIHKKLIIISGMFASAIVSLIIGVLLSIGYISSTNTGSWWILILTSLFMSSIMGTMMPALQAIIPEIVSTKNLMNAVALNTLGMNILNLFAPGLAGFIIDAFDFNIVYFTMTGCYVGSATIFSFIRSAAKPAPGGGPILGEIKKGFQYIGKHSLIKYVLVFTLIMVVLSMPYQQLLPIFVDDILKVGATGMGLLMMVTGAGALIGSIILAALPNKKRGLLLLLGGLISGVALVAFSFSVLWALSLTVIFFVGLSQTFRVTIGNSVLQAYTDPEYRGRVMSLNVMQWGLMSIFTFVAGILADFVPVQAVLGTLAAILILLSILATVFIRDLRKLD